MTQLELAPNGLTSIKFCLADAAAIDKYLAMLTGNYGQKTIASQSTITKDIAVAERGNGSASAI